MAEKVALLIGISEYEPGLNPLPAAVNDVDALHKLLIDPEIGCFADVKVLKNSKRQAMEEAIESLFAERQKDDVVLLFFSGHGIKDDRGSFFLATRDTQKTQGKLRRATAVESSTLHGHMKSSRSQRQVIILDCCFSSAFAEGLSAKDDGKVDIEKQLGGKGRAILASSTSTQYSYEYEGSNLSLYTRFLVEGIETGKASREDDEWITPEELHEYASKEIRGVKPDVTPQIFPIREGSKINLVRVPLGDPKERYRKEVEQNCTKTGEITPVGSVILELKRTKLKLATEEAEAIKAEVLAPYIQKFQENLLVYKQAVTDLLQHHRTINKSNRADLQRLQKELALEDQDVEDIEAKVEDDFRERQRKLQDYEQRFIEAAQREHPLTQAKREELRQMLLQPELTETDVQLIEDQIINDIETYYQSLEQYRQGFAAAVQEKYPLDDFERNRFRQLQQDSRLKDIDIKLIEAQITAEIEKYHQKREQYKQAWIRETQRKHDPGETAYAQLQQEWQRLALKQADAQKIEDEIKEQIQQFKTNSEQYKKEFDIATQQQYPLSSAKRLELKQRQQTLNLTNEDAAEIEAPIVSAIEEQLEKCQQYKQAFSEAIQYKYPITKKLRDELERLRHYLELSQETTNQIEEQILASKVSSSNTSSDPSTDQSSQSTSRNLAHTKSIDALTVSSTSRTEEEKIQASQPRQQNQRESFTQYQTRFNDFKQTISHVLARQPRRVLLFGGIAIATFLLVIIIGLLKPTPPIQTTNSVGTNPPQEQPISIPDRTSVGDKILIANEVAKEDDRRKPAFEAAKQRGAAAMAKENYEEAVTAYTEALQAYPNAPETLIYLNNARIGANKAYEVAVSVPITGPPEYASKMLRGFAQAQNEVNENQGINGVKLKFKILDDSDKPDVAKQIASAIVQDSDVLAVLGHWSSPTSIQAAPIYGSGKIPFITPISTVTELSGLSPYVFRTNLTTETGGKTLATYALRSKKDKIAIFFDSTSLYCKELNSFFSGAMKQGGGSVVTTFDLSDSNLNIADSLDQAKKQGAEAVLLIPAPTSLDKALQVVTTNKRDLFLLGDIANLYTYQTLKVGGEDAVEMVMAVAWHIGEYPNSSFTRQSKALWNADVDWATAMSYNAAQAIIEALRRETNPSREGIQQTLRASDFLANGAYGEIRFSQSGDANAPVRFVKVQAANPSRSGTGYDFVFTR